MTPRPARRPSRRSPRASCRARDGELRRDLRHQERRHGLKTLTPTGTVTDGNSGNNYTYTFVPANTGTITARPLTITAAANTKVYDSTTSAATPPTITSGVLQDSETPNFIEIYNNKNVGTSKTLTPSGTVTDGNSGNNYTYTFVAANVGTITARPLTVTAQTNTKGYDGTTSAAATPLITSGVLQDSETANFIETYDTKAVGTSKTLTPSGTVNDGNTGLNYSYTFVTDTTGVITIKTLTVTATAQNKVYDGTTAATVTLSDNRAAGDNITVSDTSAAFSDKNVGNGKTVTVSGISISGPDSGDYTLGNTTATATANITARALTITAAGVDKVYDGNTTATVNLSDNRVSGDVFTDSYVSASFSPDGTADTGKTVNVTGISITGADAGNYTFNTTANTIANITQRVLTVTAHGVNKTYDGTATATVTLTDDRVAGDNVVPNITSATFSDRNVGVGKTVTVVLSTSIGGADHKNYVMGPTTIGTSANITAEPLTITAVTNTKNYDGNTSAVATPTITSGAVQDADTANFIETYDTRNVGTGKTLTPSGTVTDSMTLAASGNYTYTFVNNTTGVINKTNLTITAATNTKVYNDTTSAAATPTVTSGAIQDTDTANFIETYDTKNAGNGKTLTPSGTVTDSITHLASGNYNITFANNTTGVITKLALTVSATGVNKVYDGTTAATVTLSDNRQPGDVFTDQLHHGHLQRQKRRHRQDRDRERHLH